MASGAGSIDEEIDEPDPAQTQAAQGFAAGPEHEKLTKKLTKTPNLRHEVIGLQDSGLIPALSPQNQHKTPAFPQGLWS